MPLSSQDTNSLQYALMKHIAGAHDHVTIVGDPDQSSMTDPIHVHPYNHMANLILDSLRLEIRGCDEYSEHETR